MMKSVFNVAGTIAERSGWTFSNLSLQKLTYLAQMLHLGESGAPLFQEDFEAWDYGPVVPVLYHELKMFGSGPVAPYSALVPMKSLPAAEENVVKQIVEIGKERTPGNLVAITHWEKGAWASVYAKHIRGLKIPKDLIKAEFDLRMRGVAA
jgi:uncharacterized phage-associated protein